MLSYANFYALMPADNATPIVPGGDVAFPQNGIIANKIRVFESKSWKVGVVVPELLKFYSSRAAVGVIGDIGLPTFLAVIGLDAPIFGVEGLVSKMIVTPVVILMNYLLGKFFVFRKKK